MITARLLLTAWVCTMTVGAGAADLHGIWQIRGPVTLASKDNTTPPLTAAGKVLFAKNHSAILAGDRSVDLTLRCASPGAPRIMLLPYPFEILQQPDHVLFAFQWNHLFRQIVMSDRRDPYILPSAMGFSSGHWEGGALVITTNFFSTQTFLDGQGLPHGDKLILTERLHLRDHGHVLEWQATVDDPEYYTRTWQASAKFERLARASLSEDVCVDRVAAGKPAIELRAKRQSAAHAPSRAPSP
jgi:hypothetical protein